MSETKEEYPLDRDAAIEKIKAGYHVEDTLGFRHRACRLSSGEWLYEISGEHGWHEPIGGASGDFYFMMWPNDLFKVVYTPPGMDEALQRTKDTEGFYVEGEPIGDLPREFEVSPHVEQYDVDFTSECVKETKVEKTKHQLRKERPLFSGVLRYFPDALLELANLSRVGNEQHNPGQPLHWAYGKSMDHGDCIMRHQLEYDQVDDDGILHAVKVFWRAGAQLQTLLEKRNSELHARRQAERDRAAKGE